MIQIEYIDKNNIRQNSKQNADEICEIPAGVCIIGIYKNGIPQCVDNHTQITLNEVANCANWEYLKGTTDLYGTYRNIDINTLILLPKFNINNAISLQESTQEPAQEPEPEPTPRQMTIAVSDGPGIVGPLAPPNSIVTITGNGYNRSYVVDSSNYITVDVLPAALDPYNFNLESNNDQLYQPKTLTSDEFNNGDSIIFYYQV